MTAHEKYLSDRVESLLRLLRNQRRRAARAEARNADILTHNQWLCLFHVVDNAIKHTTNVATERKYRAIARKLRAAGGWRW
jgi:hypothetical protein